MSSVNLNHIYIHKGDNLSDYIEAEFAEPLTEVSNRQGRVKRYAGGRFRAVNPKGKMSAVKTQINWLPEADLDKLHEWAGELVMIRDARGRLLFGVYRVVSAQDYRAHDNGSTAIEITEITHSIEV